MSKRDRRDRFPGPQRDATTPDDTAEQIRHNNQLLKDIGVEIRRYEEIKRGAEEKIAVLEATINNLKFSTNQINDAVNTAIEELIVLHRKELEEAFHKGLDSLVEVTTKARESIEDKEAQILGMENADELIRRITDGVFQLMDEALDAKMADWDNPKKLRVLLGSLTVPAGQAKGIPVTLGDLLRAGREPPIADGK